MLRLRLRLGTGEDELGAVVNAGGCRAGGRVVHCCTSRIPACIDALIGDRLCVGCRRLGSLSMGGVAGACGEGREGCWNDCLCLQVPEVCISTVSGSAV